jgi:hypothetical protein
MATDGVRIIDGDSAHDTYWGIMNLYDNGATIETINSHFTFPQVDYFDDFDYEIYSTSYALAIWEIGHMNEYILQEVKKVIEKGVCVKEWTEECNEKLGKARQKELDKLWKKISSENNKVRKVKKYKIITNFLFEIDDVLTFQLSDNDYCATILLDIRQYRGFCTYSFGSVVYKEKKLPQLENIANYEIIGRKIPSNLGVDFMKSILLLDTEEIIKKGGIDRIYQQEAEKTGNFIIGMDKIGIEHRDLINFKDKFHKIGQIKIKDEFKTSGSYSSALNFDGFTKNFPNLEKL